MFPIISINSVCHSLIVFWKHSFKTNLVFSAILARLINIFKLQFPDLQNIKYDLQLGGGGGVPGQQETSHLWG